MLGGQPCHPPERRRHVLHHRLNNRQQLGAERFLEVANNVLELRERVGRSLGRALELFRERRHYLRPAGAFLQFDAVAPQAFSVPRQSLADQQRRRLEVHRPAGRHVEHNRKRLHAGLIVLRDGDQPLECRPLFPITEVGQALLRHDHIFNGFLEAGVLQADRLERSIEPGYPGGFLLGRLDGERGHRREGAADSHQLNADSS